MTTYSYGTWDSMVDLAREDVRYFIESTLDDYNDDYTIEFDVDAIEKDFRAAINDALPVGVTLVGEEFFGPDNDPDPELVMYEFPEIIDQIDLWAIAQRHITSP